MNELENIKSEFYDHYVKVNDCEPQSWMMAWFNEAFAAGKSQAIANIADKIRLRLQLFANTPIAERKNAFDELVELKNEITELQKPAEIEEGKQ